MAVDFTLPVNSDPYLGVLAQLRDNIASAVAFLEDATPTGIATGAKRWNTTGPKFERWNGASWAAMTLGLSGGGTGATSASAALDNFGGTTTGKAVFTASSQANARTALGLGTLSTQSATMTTFGKSVLEAADTAAGRTALGLGTAAVANIGTSGDSVPKTNAANTWSAAQVVALTTTGGAFTIQTSASGASAAPDFNLIRDKGAGGSNGDGLGRIIAYGRDAGNNLTAFVVHEHSIVTATDGAEVSAYRMITQVGGAAVAAFQVSNGAQVGSPTGGYLGTGALNATRLAINGVDVRPEASVTEWRTNTADKSLTTDVVWSSMAEVTITDTGTLAWDMGAGFDFVVTLGGARTMGAPTNAKVGQKGRLRVVQDGTGGRTITWNAAYDFGGGTAPTLSTAAGAKDVLYYDVITTGSILITTGAKAYA